MQIYTLLFDQHGSREENVAVEKAVNAVKNWFYGRTGRWLFILDSADTIDNVEDDTYIELSRYLPDTASVDVIITTRSSEAKEMSELVAVEVAELKIEEAVKLFTHCAKLKTPPEKEVVSIVKELGCLALAISPCWCIRRSYTTSEIQHSLLPARVSRAAEDPPKSEA